MIGRGLKLRYVLAVVATGALLTAAVATSTALSARHQAAHLRAAVQDLAALGTPPGDRRAAELRAELEYLLARNDSRSLALVVVVGLLLTALAGGVTAVLLTRVDRALNALMANARLIGQGHYSEPVSASGVAEVASLERSLEQMRQALASTAST